MELNDINLILSRLADDKAGGRNHILTLAAALIEWTGLQFVENSVPRLLDFQTIKLKEALVGAPVTGQEQLYRLTAENQPVRVRFAVFKKYDKKMIHYLVDGNVGLASYQAAMRGIKQIEGREPYIARQPYFIHFITTAKYDRLWVVFNDGEQKRVLVFRNRLTQTQFSKIMPAWRNIAAKSKPEMAKLFWSSLDVKEVNKDFYQHIKERFDALTAIAKTQQKHIDENTVKQFAVRLIGRYIFCWFLKEKEIIPESLLASGTIEKYRNIYFQQCLAKLFFNTLNAEVTDHARNLAINDELDVLYKNIPYLNGGLFDWHPEDELFEKLDLNAWLIDFVKVLESFDFTVDESSSQYQQVAIDPEMLGRIFENLLASQNPDTEKMANQRKAFGAFYTPREIVDYMVNESLKAYLENQMLPQLPEQPNVVREPQAAYNEPLFQHFEPPKPIPVDIDKSKNADIERRRERIKTKIDKLFVPDCAENPFDKEETIQARKALSEITILDPAGGSGAFPMGVMLRLMELRQIIGHGHRNSYDLKEEILGKNIFGVDIMPMAVEIARLRAWLSLVLEADYKPADRKNNFGIAALPNLDFKFVCANSLIDSGYDDFLSKIQDTGEIQHYRILSKLDGEIQKLEALRDAYFDPKGDKNRKKELQKEFLKTKDYIKTEFVSLKKSWNLGDFLDKVDDWNPFDDSHPSSFFSPAWMFGVRNGFDVVIGNPPWVQIQKLPEAVKNALAAQNYKTFSRSADLYCLFYERGAKLLADSGMLSLITSNKFFRAGYGKALRKMLTQDYQIVQAIDFGELPVFEAGTDPAIIMIDRKKRPDFMVVTIKEKEELLDLCNTIKNRKFCMTSSDLPESGWTFARSEIVTLINSIKIVGAPLKKIIDNKLYRGILTGFNDAFIIDESTKIELIDKDPKSADIIKPWLRGTDIKRWYGDWQHLFIIFTRQGINIDQYPAIKSYLAQFKKQLTPQKNDSDEIGRKPGKYLWYEIQDQINYYEGFECKKIVYNETSKELHAFIDSDSLYINKTGFIILAEEPEYILGILNSALMDYYYRHEFPSWGDPWKGGRIQFRGDRMEQIPIAPTTSEQRTIMKRLVNLMQSYYQGIDSVYVSSVLRSSVNILFFEQWLNGLVYELYFPESLHGKGCYIFKETATLFNAISPRNDMKNSPEMIELYENANNIQGQLRTMLFSLQAVEQIRTIEVMREN